jgi:peptidoglycan hydrolase-like protein with peptidoglycan-binding domain
MVRQLDGDSFGEKTVPMKNARLHRPALSAAAALAAVATVIGLGACSSPAPKNASSQTRASTPVTTASAPASSQPTATPAATGTPAATAPPSTSPSSAPPAAEPKLKFGSSGTAVMQLQQRLTSLGYWLGTPNGKFNTTTQQAVFALQKATGISPSGTVAASTWKALAAGTRPVALSTSGRVIEVDLKRDLVLFVTDGQVKYILNTSTGGGYTFYDQGQRNVAVTPKGHYHTNRTIDGLHRSTLGLLYRPRYFNGGIAIHGDSSVPSHPVSHGCVRVTDAAMDWIWKDNLDPVGTEVWVR